MVGSGLGLMAVGLAWYARRCSTGQHRGELFVGWGRRTRLRVKHSARVSRRDAPTLPPVGPHVPAAGPMRPVIPMSPHWSGLSTEAQ